MELFEDALERVRLRYLFAVAGYVVMPEHVHLLVNEPGRGLLSRTVQALKLSVSMRSRERPFWQAHYYDFNVPSHQKFVERVSQSGACFTNYETRCGEVALHSCFVSGHDFSRAEKGRNDEGFQPLRDLASRHAGHHRNPRGPQRANFVSWGGIQSSAASLPSPRSGSGQAIAIIKRECTEP
jgi:hypothetical protein